MDVQIIKKAKKLCRVHNTTDPYRICKERDIIVLVKDTMPKQLKGLTVTKRRIHFIYLNSLVFLHEKEREFVLGHELGHIFLGHKDNVLFTKTATLQVQNKEENEADLFSTAILLERLDKDDLKRLTIDQIHQTIGADKNAIEAYIKAYKSI